MAKGRFLYFSCFPMDFIAAPIFRHELTTFRNLEEGRVSGEVFVNSPTPITVNNGM
jgi:hypothetical protein